MIMLGVIIAVGLALVLIVPDGCVLAEIGAVMALAGFLAIPVGIGMGFLSYP